MRGYRDDGGTTDHDHNDFFVQHVADGDAVYYGRFNLLGLVMELSCAADLYCVAECDGCQRWNLCANNVHYYSPRDRDWTKGNYDLLWTAADNHADSGREPCNGHVYWYCADCDLHAASLIADGNTDHKWRNGYV